ncbi:MAG: sigma-70 family RNA polymerase sigma factor [Clostridiales bacterium]|nr:sigma-70 family RNA polymerase sigma factor [Clostridiales bacterium]
MKKSSDETLAAAAQAGDRRAEEQLIARYKGQVRLRAKAYYILGADREDVVQEGMIGLFKAVRGYDPEGGAAFATYASVCIDRQIQDAIKAAARKKHEPLNTSLSLDEESGARIAAAQFGAAAEAGAAGMPGADDLLSRMQGEWKDRFSELERYVFEGRLAGKSVKQMADEQGKDPKAIYNAAERMKKKIRKMVQESGMLH